ncbi:ABC transporter ATP-binding protein [bacterium]|nr:ABC transporter ATP-binding protein [candidate division CSSED10-310 bacterium]
MQSPAIRITDVTKAFKKHHRRRHFLTLKSSLIRDIWKTRREEEDLFWALRGITLDVQCGETLGLIGSNGSGKSTLLKIIAGILKPTAGRLHINGRLSALIELGAGFHPEISGRENVFINGIMLGLSKHEITRKFNEIVDFAELWEFIDNPVRTYSSGMFMRLGFSVAIHVNPEILLIDEILAVGDQAFVHKCLERIFDFKRRRKTIVIVSHDLASVEKLCSRVVWLSKGEQKLVGASREVIDAYLVSIAEREEERFATRHQQILESLEKSKNQEEIECGETETSVGETEDRRGPKRWGTREIEIVSVRFLDGQGTERHVFQSGERVDVQIDYYAGREVAKPVFGIGFYLPDGTWCYGTNTRIEGIEIDSVQGSGRIRISFQELRFVENTYLVSVAVHAEDETPYDYHNKLYQLAVRSRIKEAGIYRVSHEWDFSDGPHRIRSVSDESEGKDGQ